MNKLIKGFSILATFTLLLTHSPVSSSAAQTVQKETPLSTGVQYKQYKNTDTGVNTINHLTIDANDPTTKVQVGLPAVKNGKESTTAMAMRNSIEGNRVIGAINAGFFNMSEGYPLFLLAKDNVILNGGAISVGADQYMNVPTAFGMTRDGKGLIDYYQFDVTLSYKGKKYEMTGLNHSREKDNAVIYTPQFHSKTTKTNEYGFEIVVDTGKPITQNTFDQTLSGRVTKVTGYGSIGNTPIPPTGFVISLQGGEWHEKLSHIAVGDEISTQFAINDQWNDAEFILASGPYLVRDGKPYIMMSANSSRVKEIAPRTVVATNKDGSVVHFITVDGRQRHSKGMNMSQLANYLVKLGVDRAINLDGGGSTTMAIRTLGSYNIGLANKPSNAGNYQRLVSNILQAVSTAPLGSPKHIKHTSDTNYATLLAGASSGVKIQYIWDENNNPLPINASRVNLSSQNGTLNTSGLRFKTTTPGEDRIYINYDGKAVQSFPVNIVDAPERLAIIPAAKELSAGETIALSIDAKDGAGKPVVYDSSQLTWSVEGNIGTVTKDGKFTAKKAGASGKVTAKLGAKTVSASIIVKNHSLFKDIPADYHYYNEVESLTKQQVITGYLDDTFKPDNSLTRSHAAVIIARALKLDLSGGDLLQFEDVPASNPYYKEIAAMVRTGIMSGKDKTTFDPGGTLTRKQMAKVIAIAYNLEGVSSKNFIDVPKDDWSYDYVQALAANNVTTGYEGGIYKPSIPISRVHFSVFLYRAINL